MLTCYTTSKEIQGCNYVNYVNTHSKALIYYSSFNRMHSAAHFMTTHYLANRASYTVICFNLQMLNENRTRWLATTGILPFPETAAAADSEIIVIYCAAAAAAACADCLTARSLTRSNCINMFPSAWLVSSTGAWWVADQTMHR